MNIYNFGREREYRRPSLTPKADNKRLVKKTYIYTYTYAYIFIFIAQEEWYESRNVNKEWKFQS